MRAMDDTRNKERVSEQVPALSSYKKTSTRKSVLVATNRTQHTISILSKEFNFWARISVFFSLEARGVVERVVVPRHFFRLSSLEDLHHLTQKKLATSKTKTR